MIQAASPTSNPEAEQTLLGAMLLSEEYVHVIMSKVAAEDFTPGFNQSVYAAMVSLIDQGYNIDIVPVASKLAEMGERDAESIQSFLLEIRRLRPARKTVLTCMDMVLMAANRRRIAAAADNLHVVIAGGGDVTGALEELVAAGMSRTANQVVGAAAGAEMMMNLITSERTKHVSTGLPDLDRLLNGGLRPGQLITVGARPAMGKSAFALGLAYQALKDHHKVLYISAEMGVEELLLRLTARMARIPLSVLTSVDVNEELSPGEWEKIGNTAQAITEFAMDPGFDFIDGAPSVAEIRSIAKAAQAQGKPYGLIVVDYLQLLTPPKGKESRQNEVSEISRTMKQMAREIQAPVVSLSQLNRGLEGRSDKRPMLSDLRESGSLEQDSDVVIFLYRPEVYDPDDNPGVIEQIVSKQRSGPTGLASGTFLGEYAAVVAAARPETEAKW